MNTDHFTGLWYDKVNPHPLGLHLNDCATRALCLAENIQYQEAHRHITATKQWWSSRSRSASYSLKFPLVIRAYGELGWRWVANSSDLGFTAAAIPKDRVIVVLNQHLTFVDHHVVKDSSDVRGTRTRKLYGWFTKDL